MGSVLLISGIAASIFVGFNVGGSSTGIAWGPTTGARIVEKTTAAVLMTICALLGGWTVGRNVIDTLAGDVVAIPMSLGAGVAILAFIGLGILAGNVLSVPVPTSMTTVGSIAGLGLATDTLNLATIGRIVSWWILAPFVGFFAGLVFGRHFYPKLVRRFGITRSEGPLLTLDRSAPIPRPTLGPNTTPRELVGTSVLLIISCYMAFSAGASNIPNAVAPLVSSGALGTDTAILIAAGAIAAGALTIARRTMESVGTELTDISLFAALVVLAISATITTGLSAIGVPISLVMGTVSTIAGLGWGRATRPISLADAVRGDLRKRRIALGALGTSPDVPIRAIGEAESAEVLEQASDLFDRRALARYVTMWVISPSISLALSYLFFLVFPLMQ